MRESNFDRVRAAFKARPGESLTCDELKQIIPTIERSVYQAVSRMRRNGELRSVRKASRPAYAYVSTYVPQAPNKAPPPPKPSARQQALISGLARSPRRTSGRALLYSVTLGPSKNHCPKRAASDRIAADIAAFEAKGGQVERLGNTERFRI